MQNKLFKLYPLIRETLTWARLIERISNFPEIGDEKKDQWRVAIEFLKKELGAGFFNNCGSDHPVYIKLTNTPWLLDDLIDFVNTLKTLKCNSHSYSYLLTKIKPRIKCITEGVPFVEIASTFIKQGFNVNFLERNYFQKSPDIELLDISTSKRIYIEVSQINDSIDRKQSNDEFRIISNTLTNYGFDLLYSYKQLKHLNKKDIGEIIIRIKEMKDEVAANKTMLIYRNDSFDLAIAHPERNEDMINWCKEAGRDQGTSGLPVDFNDTHRIIDNKKIHKKAKQIPVNEIGIIYLPVHFLYFFVMDTAETVGQIIEEIAEYPNLLGVVLYANLGQDTKEDYVEMENTIRSVKMINGIARHLLFVFNYDFKGNIEEYTWEKIKKAF